MNYTVKIKRGLKANIPTLEVGELAETTDENELYIGSATGNKKLTSKAEIEVINGQVQNIEDELISVNSSLNERAKYLKPTGTSDDTSYLQNAIDNYSSVVLTPGVYNVNAVIGWNIPSNRNITFEEGAILQVITNNSGSYQTIFVNHVTNVTIDNPTVIGERLTHIGSTGEWGYGIYVNASTNVKIYNPKCSNCWGDGITIGESENVFVENAFCDNNRRQGITIGSGKNITLLKPTCINTNGALPSAGIDIEPDTNIQSLENINIISPVTKNNAGGGIVIALFNLLNAVKSDISINITNHYDYNSLFGLYIAKLEKGNTGVITGKINIESPVYQLSKNNGILVENYSADNTAAIKISNPTIINPNENNSAIVLEGSGISIYRDASATNTNTLGNVLITNPDIKDIRTTHRMIIGIYVEDGKAIGYSKCIIQNPIAIDGVADIIYKIWINKSGVKVIDDNKVCSQTCTTDITMYPRVYTQIDNNTAPAIVTFNLDTSATLIDAPITFIVKTYAAGIKLKPSATMSIRPLSTVDGKYIQSTQLGASITLRKFNSVIWIVEKMIGTWTVEA